MAEERLFPVLDRNTPVLNRLRNGSKGKEDSISTAIIEILNSDDKEQIEKIADETISDIRKNISEATDVPESAVDGKFLDRLEGSLIDIKSIDVISDLEREEEEEQDEDGGDDQTEIEKF